MHKVIRFFNKRSSIILLFYMSVLLFNWPLLSITADKDGSTLFAYIFIAWGVVVALLMVTGFAIRQTTNTDQKD